MSERKKTDKLLHENVDCRILWNEQHQLGIDVGGNVKFADPHLWHALKQTVGRTKSALDAYARRCFELESQLAKLREAASKAESWLNAAIRDGSIPDENDNNLALGVAVVLSNALTESEGDDE